MILYEYEGKQLFSQSGIKIPNFQLISSPNEPLTISPPVVLKAQVLSGKRADVGGIIIANTEEEIKKGIKDLLGKVVNKEKVEKILLEEKISINSETYLSITYDTDFRGPVITISKMGGTGIEDRQAKSFPIDILNPDQSLEIVSKLGVDLDILKKAFDLFLTQDCLLLEINPLVKNSKDEWIALDAKIKLDDTASSRHKEWAFPPRGVPGYAPTQNEIEAKKIDEGDYRGTAGSAYFDLDGDIAILSSGGGVSLTALDALIASGGKPANFTEYSGNPPKEKVAKLTKIVLSKPNIHGLWVIGTVVANFTDIYETLSGLIEGLRIAQNELGKKFDFPIVIRRGGPRDQEAFEMLKQNKDFDLTLQGEEASIAESAKIMTEKAMQYKNSKHEILNSKQIQN